MEGWIGIDTVNCFMIWSTPTVMHCFEEGKMLRQCSRGQSTPQPPLFEQFELECPFETKSLRCPE